MQFEVYKDAAGEWRWRLKAANGEIGAFGESYKNKKDAIDIVKKIQTEAPRRAIKIETK
jgi:uncharacterized protein YegP (UPF0339 family)